MCNRPTVYLSYAILLIAGVASLFLVHSLGPTSFRASVGFGMWLLLPYTILAVLLATTKRAECDVPNLVVTLLVVIGGLCFLAYVIFIRPDPQGGIAVFFAPIYQGAAIVLLVPLSRLLLGKRST